MKTAVKIANQVDPARAVESIWRERPRTQPDLYDQKTNKYKIKANSQIDLWENQRSVEPMQVMILQVDLILDENTWVMNNGKSVN
jgi:hypothetical protein